MCVCPFQIQSLLDAIKLREDEAKKEGPSPAPTPEKKDASNEKKGSLAE